MNVRAMHTCSSSVKLLLKIAACITHGRVYALMLDNSVEMHARTSADERQNY